jgi:hypothetical protein
MDDDIEEVRAGGKGRPAPRRVPAPPREMPLIEQDRKARDEYFRAPGDFKGPTMRAAKTGGLIKADGCAIRGKTRGTMT